MGSNGEYKRNQVEQAVIAALAGGPHGSATDLRIRIKRLLDADRGSDKDPQDQQHDRYAFYSGRPPGRGGEVWFSSYEAFALLVALRLLAHGLPQGTVVEVMRAIRRDVEGAYRRIMAQDPAALFDAKEELAQARPGMLATGSTKPVFLAIAALNKPGPADGRRYEVRICRDHEALMNFILKELPLGTTTTTLELGTSAHRLSQHLAKTQPSRRGPAR